MTSIDNFLYRYRWPIGVFLVLVIIFSATGLIYKTNLDKKDSYQKQIDQLAEQNDLLRQELAGKSKAVLGDQSQEEAGEKININSASLEELDSLPDIGPARAADIIAYREKNAGFKTIEEIKEIKGIGDKSFEKLKDLITIGQ